jgi:tryptophanyl-tRNA synthetase
MNTVISGITPSSNHITLGNYLGAIKNCVDAQLHENLYRYYFIADLHAITVRQDPKTFPEQVLSIAAWYLAAGLDPKKSTLFVQSHVPEHAELGWILQTFTQMGELERMTQFKDKSARHTQNINAGLFTYPSLMAADILLYQAYDVPVGEDQTQHLELTRDIAIRFNNAYGNTFTVPQAVIQRSAARVKDLQHPEKKMSKSDLGLGTILLTDTPDDIRKKISKATTDAKNKINYDTANQPGISNLLSILAVIENKEPEDVAIYYCDYNYNTFKKIVLETLIAELEPIQKKYQEISKNKDYIRCILVDGAKKARKVAKKTLYKVKQKMGFTNCLQSSLDM